MSKHDLTKFRNRGSAETRIDVAGMREDHWTDLGECKWGRGALPLIGFKRGRRTLSRALPELHRP